MVTTASNGAVPQDVREAARYYFEHGLTPIPVAFRGKKCYLDDWPALRREALDVAALFPPGGNYNVGVLTGAPSGGLVDVDLDAPEALVVAPYLLPPTGWVFGHASKRGSHWLYKVECPPESKSEYSDLDHTILCELRSGKCQTVFPPSIHETGEPIEWQRFESPAEVSAADLADAVGAVAAAALLARRWPARGVRHKVSLALIGGLARAGWNKKRIEAFLQAVCAAAHDEDGRGRLKNVPTTLQRLGQNEPVSGWPTLAELLGKDGPIIVQRVQEWLGLAPVRMPPPWDEPIPLGEHPDVLPFPLEVLPERLRTFVEEIAWAMNVPFDFAGVPLLVLAGGALANGRHLAITSTHVQAPALYAAYVAPPGATKTAPLKLLRRPLDVVQASWLEEWHTAMKDWKQADAEQRGPRPVLRRCLVSDITTESLGLTLDDNPRGVVMIRNELSALVAGLNQYKGGKGHDRQVFLSLWDGDALIIDRKSDKAHDGAPLYVLHPFTAIIGNLQPDVLGRLRGEVTRGTPPPNDGFLDRFLFAYPPDQPAIGEQWREVTPALLDLWQSVVERLLGLAMVEEGERPRPFLVSLTGCGRRAWEAFTHAHAAEMNDPHFCDFLRGPWSKLKGYCGRLALIVHYLRWACDEVCEEHVDGESFRRAIRLIDYFKSHCRKVHAVMDTDPRLGPAGKLLRWFADNGVERFRKRDVHQAFRAVFKTIEQLDSVLALLEKHGLIRLDAIPEHGGPGRKPSPIYEVHPHIAAGGVKHSEYSEDSERDHSEGWEVVE